MDDNISDKDKKDWENFLSNKESLPNKDTNTYETSTAFAAGITGRLPIDGYKKIVGNIETNVSLRNSYSSIVFGLSLPIQ